MHLIRRFFALAALPLLVPLAAASAQQRQSYELPSISLTAPGADDPMHDQVMTLYEQARWKDAATLYEAAARKLPQNDPSSYGDYDRAGRLYFYAGDYASARKMMERAGDVAVATGDMVNAGMRFTDAAFCAVWEGYAGKRRELVQKAEKAAAEKSVPTADRERILARTRGVGMLSMKGS